MTSSIDRPLPDPINGSRPDPLGCLPGGQAGDLGSVGQPDWAVVRRLRRAVDERLSAALSTRTGLSADSQRELARHLITGEVAAWVDQLASQGEPLPTPEQEEALDAAVYAAIYALGRLQPLIDDPAVEDIEIGGHDVVWLHYADGRRVPGPPVADSDAELIELLQGWATYHGQTSRDFSTARPTLNLRLPDGSRLAAIMAVTPRPQVAIRRHRLVDVDLSDMVAVGTLDETLAGFLRAAVRARLNIVVTGVMGAGKTTLLRALANEIDPTERIGTLEKEYELALHELPERHAPGRVVAMEAREGNAEAGAGAISLHDLVPQSLRMNLRRIIVGEVRSDEIIPMLDAMASGGDGSLCTLHVKRGVNPLTRMVSLAMRGADALSEHAAHQLIATAVDLIVHIDLIDEPALFGTAAGARRRVVSQVLEVTGVGEGGRVATNEVFAPGPDGRAMPATTPACLPDLVATGFLAALLDEAGGLR